jgi:hypothetical protein
MSVLPDAVSDCREFGDAGLDLVDPAHVMFRINFVCGPEKLGANLGAELGSF